MSALFSPFTLKDARLRNRIAVSPMCQYSAEEGVANLFDADSEDSQGTGLHGADRGAGALGHGPAGALRPLAGALRQGVRSTLTPPSRSWRGCAACPRRSL